MNIEVCRSSSVPLLTFRHYDEGLVPHNFPEITVQGIVERMQLQAGAERRDVHIEQSQARRLRNLDIKFLGQSARADYGNCANTGHVRVLNVLEHRITGM